MPSVDYNEDLSAFHGPTLDIETAYTSSAISYTLSLYPPDTRIIVMGNSMGGIVATSLLPSSNISAVITMSTPHQLPPTCFDRRIASIYNNHRAALATANTPILLVCGGTTDLMVPSESCILPEVPDIGVYRQTVFSSALEGCWTGVGHQVVVWCHQVRWRVAQAVLELSAASSSAERGAVLDRWLHDRSSRLPVVGSPIPRGLNLTLYTSQDCNVASLYLCVHRWGSLGRAGARYWTAVPGWAVGVIVWMLFSTLGDTSVEVRLAIIFFSRCNTDAYDEAPMPSVFELLSRFTCGTLPRGHFRRIAPPTTEGLCPQQRRQGLFRTASPVVLLITTGPLVVRWWILHILMWPICKFKCILARTKSETG